MNITIDKDGWIKEAIGIYYPNRSWGAFTQKPREIVLHGTATPQGTAQDIATGWRNVDGDASAHIIINKDGSFVQGLSLNSTAWANCCLTDNPNTGGMWDRRLPVGNQNQWSIAIEHCKDDPNENSDALTPAQQAASFALVKAICEYHNIPKAVVGYEDISNGGVIGHCTIDTLNRTYCPGTYPWAALRDSLKGATHMPIPSGWHFDAATETLTPPNSKYVVTGNIAKKVLSMPSWDANNTPLENAVRVSQGELHVNPPQPALRQIFLSAMELEIAGRGVVSSALGAEVAKCYNVIAQLEAQLKVADAEIATLKAQTPPASGAIGESITALQAQIASLQMVKSDAEELLKIAQPMASGLDVALVTAQNVVNKLSGK